MKSIKPAVGRMLLASLGKNSIITFQHIVIQVLWEIARLLHLLLALFSGFKKSSPRSYWAFLLAVHSTEAAPKFAPADGRCLVFPQLILTWLPGYKLSRSTAKQYATRCFWKLLRWHIGITVTEYWLIFEQRCLVWPFDRSSWVIDSRLS